MSPNKQGQGQRDEMKAYHLRILLTYTTFAIISTYRPPVLRKLRAATTNSSSRFCGE